MYYTHEFKTVDSPHVVRMTFELPYLDWCRFQKSKLFRDLTAYLEELEKQNTRNVHQENPNESRER